MGLDLNSHRFTACQRVDGRLFDPALVLPNILTSNISMPSQNPPPTEVVEQRQYRVRIQEGEAKLSGGSTAWNKRAAGVRQYNNANRIERRMARGLCRRAAVKPAWEEAYFQPDNVLYKTRMRTRGRNRERGKGTNQQCRQRFANYQHGQKIRGSTPHVSDFLLLPF